MPFSLNMVLPQRVYEALSAVLVIIVASSVAHLPYAQWLVVRNVVTLISMCEHEHTGSFQLSGMLRIVLLLSVFVAVPAPNPNIQEGVTDLPSVKIWDGIPYHEFRQEWYQTLKSALGSIAQDGWTLLQTANDQDIGGPGNPGNAVQTDRFWDLLGLEHAT